MKDFAAGHRFSAAAESKAATTTTQRRRKGKIATWCISHTSHQAVYNFMLHSGCQRGRGGGGLASEGKQKRGSKPPRFRCRPLPPPPPPLPPRISSAFTRQRRTPRGWGAGLLVTSDVYEGRERRDEGEREETSRQRMLFKAAHTHTIASLHRLSFQTRSSSGASVSTSPHTHTTSADHNNNNNNHNRKSRTKREITHRRCRCRRRAGGRRCAGSRSRRSARRRAS